MIWNVLVLRVKRHSLFCSTEQVWLPRWRLRCVNMLWEIVFPLKINRELWNFDPIFIYFFVSLCWQQFAGCFYPKCSIKLLCVFGALIKPLGRQLQTHSSLTYTCTMLLNHWTTHCMEPASNTTMMSHPLGYTDDTSYPWHLLRQLSDTLPNRGDARQPLVPFT